MSTRCYVPVKGIDDVIASKLGPAFNKYTVATLRGMYDESKPKELDTSDLSKAALTLAQFRHSIITKSKDAMNNVRTNAASSYDTLRRNFTAEERYNRVNMIASMFSALVDNIVKNAPHLSRKAIIEGYTKDGVRYAGEFAVFEKVYNQLLQMQAFHRENGDNVKADSFMKVIDNWNAFTTFARIRLRDTEGIKLGNKLEFAEETSELNYGDNDLSQLFNAEEAPRDHWTTTSGMESSFGSIGRQVRKLLGELPVVELKSVTKPNGMVVQDYVVKRDDLGFVITQDPIRLHQSLSETFRGITSEAQMIGALSRNGKPKEPWMKPLREALMSSPELRIQFYVDFKKNFQPYSILTEDKDNFKSGLRLFKTKLLNKVEDILGGAFMARVILGKPLNVRNSVFDSKGDVIPSKLKEVFSDIGKWLNVDKSKNALAVSKFFDPENNKPEDFLARRQFLTSTLEALGIDIDADTLLSIMRNSKKVRALTKHLEELAKYGLLQKHRESLKNNETIPYKTILKAENSHGDVVFLEKISKINTIISGSREGLRLESRCRHKDSKGNNITLFSHVNPSFLGDRIDEIQSYVNANDKDGLRTYLTNTYLKSSFFYDNGEVLNKWLEELLKCCDDKNTPLYESFAAQFTYSRDLGTLDISFENFTSKQHMIDMLTRYRADREISKGAKTGEYPIFILGDSGVSKYIRALRYDDRSIILDGLYNVYRQERRRQELVKASNKYLSSQGFQTIDNFSKSENTFSTLQFLNPTYKSPDGTVGKFHSMLGDNPSEKKVKEVIQKAMKEAVAEFKNNLDRLGLLESSKVKEVRKDGGVVEVEKYVFLGKNVTSSNLDEYLTDYYWNTKFATIQQLQLMTIDSSFYKDTKDLQKRYKEIHAPGTLLDIDAVYKGQKVSETGKERAVYFDDLGINAEESNKDFMEVIASIHGENSKIYNDYKDNSLTDGQGYRSMRSYRKVMIMAGKWSTEMEAAYEMIENIRATYGYDKNGNHVDIPSEKIAEITKLAVVFQPIKPYMFTHEELPVNSTDKVIIPVQHKYAEAVLIPELLPKGSKLRDMAYWMDEEDNNIDLVGSTKIVKVGCFGATNIKDVKNATELREALSKAYVHELNYSDYRIQTNVPEHINSSQLFGTQIRKLIMAGISMNDFHYQSYIDNPNGTVNLGGNHKNVKLNGRNLISFYNSLIVANILESFDKFENGISNTSKLSECLTQGVINNSRESIDNILAYSLNDDGDFSIPLFEGGLEHDAAAMILSMFKKIVNKQSIKGGSAVQVSAMGISGYDESESLKFVTSEDKKNILYAQCEIPFDISYKDEDGNEVALEFDDYCNPDGTLKMLDENTSLLESKFPGATSLIAYRIPTERDYSMLNLKVVRFSHKTAGGTIKVPAQGTTIAGFDFDVDKLYFMRREYVRKAKYSESNFSESEKNTIFAKIYDQHPEIASVLGEIRRREGDSKTPLNHFWDQMLAENPSWASDESYDKNTLFREAVKSLVKEGKLEEKGSTKSYYLDEYDYNKPPLNNSRAARNNMLIQLIQKRLMDIETLRERTTPGGFANARVSARIMRELLFGSTEGIFDETGKVNFGVLEERAKDASTDPEPTYDPTDPMTMVIYNQQNQVASKLIGIFANQNTNHAFASLMSEFKLKAPIEFAGHSYGDGRVSDFLHAPKDVDVNLNIAEFLSASVDAVKDPVLNFMNLNTITADAGAVLARIGYTTTEIGVLFNQPIIKEVCDYCFNNNVGVENAFNFIRGKYKEAGATIPKDVSKINQLNLTLDALTKNILKERNSIKNGKSAMEDINFANNQLEILELFQSIISTSNEVSQFVTSTKFTASNAVGSTMGDLYAQQMKVQKYLDKFGSLSSKVEMKVSSTVGPPISLDPDLIARPKREAYKNEEEFNKAVRKYNIAYMDSMIDNPFAYEQAMFDANRNALQAINQYFPYDKKVYSEARTFMASLTDSNTLDADTINSIHNDMMIYLLSCQERSEFNGDLPKNDTGHGEMTVREYYTKWFAKDLVKFLEINPDFKKEPIFTYMVPIVDEDTDEISIKIQDIGGLAPYTKDEIRESWALLSMNPEFSRIAKDLFLYNFYKLGFSFSPMSFMNLAPTEVKQSILVPAHDGKSRTYIEFMNEIMKNSFSINNNHFARQYILNHLDNKKFVLEPKHKKIVEYLNKQAIDQYVVNDSFTLSLSEIENISEGSSGMFIVRENESDNTRCFKPVIKIKKGSSEIFYMADSLTDVNDTKMIYHRVDKLGAKGQLLQYSSPESLEIDPSTIMFESFQYGNNYLELDDVPEKKPFSREDAINYIVEEFAKAIAKYNIRDEQGELYSVEGIKRGIINKDDAGLQQEVETLRQACRENGVLMLDENGNLQQGC